MPLDLPDGRRTRATAGSTETEQSISTDNFRSSPPCAWSFSLSPLHPAPRTLLFLSNVDLTVSLIQQPSVDVRRKPFRVVLSGGLTDHTNLHILCSLIPSLFRSRTAGSQLAYSSPRPPTTRSLPSLCIQILPLSAHNKLFAHHRVGAGSWAVYGKVGHR